MGEHGDERDDQEQVERESRATGGDAEAAGSVEEREAVATDSDEDFEEPESPSGD